MNNIKMDFITNTIIVTRKFYESAMIPMTEENIILSNIMKENPSMKISIRSVNRTKNCDNGKGLTYRYMRKFISIMDEENLPVFEKTLLYFEGLYTCNGEVYQNVKKWFLDNYPHHKDMIVDAVPQRVVPVRTTNETPFPQLVA